MTDDSIVSLGTGVIALVGTMFTTWMAYMVRRMNIRQKQIESCDAYHAHDIKQSIHDHNEVLRGQNLASISKIDAIHDMLNAKSTEQLRLFMVLARKLAEETKARIDIEAADRARDAYLESERQQGASDASAEDRP